jgi:hypothetical protein
MTLILKAELILLLNKTKIVANKSFKNVAQIQIKIPFTKKLRADYIQKMARIEL